MKKVILIIISILLIASFACAQPETSTAAEPTAEAAVKNEQTVVTAAPESVKTEPEQTEPAKPPVPEEPEYDPLPEEYLPVSREIKGEWYTEMQGVVITLELAEDGNYTVSVPGAEPLTGKWDANTGDIVLDGDENNPLLPVNEVLLWDAAGLLFTREKPETYVPAEVVAEAEAGSFDGFWKAQFVAVGDATILASALEEDTFAYIEGTNVAMGGKRFGQIIRVFSVDAGALTLEENGMNIQIRLQKDDFLCMTLSGEESAVIYLMPAPIPGQESEPNS